jgi:hypothetical protein
MRSLAFMLVALMLSGAVAPATVPQQPKLQFPKDGNGLLEYCGQLVDLFDQRLTSAADETKLGWCLGYIQASRDFILHLKINMALAGMAGVTLSGPEKARPIVTQMSDMCIPDAAPMLELARVVVKWLRDHPEHLHELPDFLLLDALKDAFPCAAPTPPAKP